MTFLTTGAVDKDIKSKIKVFEQSFLQYLILFDVLPNVPFTTGETTLDY